MKALIREYFPEDPIALAVAECESGYKMIQSHHMQPYGREESYGIFQIHARAWQEKAEALGLHNYKTDVEENIQMARYIYDQNGGWADWVCFSKNMHLAYL